MVFPGLYIPASPPATGHFFAHSRSQKPARFPAEQKERSCTETLLFLVSRGRRYNTLDLAIPAIKRLRRSLASLGDCKQSLSLVRLCRTSCKVVCHETAGFFGFFRPRRVLPSFGNLPQKAKRNVPSADAHSILLFLKTGSKFMPIRCHFSVCLASFFRPDVL